MRHMRENNADLLNTIRDEGEISDATGDKLKQAVDGFAKNFA